MLGVFVGFFSSSQASSCPQRKLLKKDPSLSSTQTRCPTQTHTHTHTRPHTHTHTQAACQRCVVGCELTTLLLCFLCGLNVYTTAVYVCVCYRETAGFSRKSHRQPYRHS
ncbi:hypothetical protein ILYODFUR_032351 [Ilyodon furcidens]|uniref:Uncharacterized protein n=1 Tax=Ilyodon furcidens TaxID=33524 RepID=A0ABV0U187_9TELE